MHRKKKWKRLTGFLLAVMVLLPAAALAEGLILDDWDAMREKYTTPVMDVRIPVTTSTTYTWSTVQEQAAQERVMIVSYEAQGTRMDAGTLAEQRICTAQTGIVIQETERRYVLFALIIDGDVLGNGQLSIAQVVRLAKAITGAAPLAGLYEQAGDLNGSGRLDIADLTILVSWLSGGVPRDAPAPAAILWRHG